MPDVRVTVFDDGPIEVDGIIEIYNEAGEVVRVDTGEPVYLCRCGGSQNKPFCDGTHNEIGFTHCVRAEQQG